MNAAWRWFSQATIRAAESYRDLGWWIVGRHLVLSVVIIVISRINPGLAIAPWLFLAGLIWLGYGVRMGVLKAVGQAARRRKAAQTPDSAQPSQDPN